MFLLTFKYFYMSSLDNLVDFVKEKIKEYPQLKNQIIDFYQLALDEIEQGSSEEQEYQSAVQSIEELIEKI